MNTSPIQYNVRTNSTDPVVGVLLVHGLNGTTGDMAELEEIFQKSRHHYKKYAATGPWQ